MDVSVRESVSLDVGTSWHVCCWLNAMVVAGVQLRQWRDHLNVRLREVTGSSVDAALKPVLVYLGQQSDDVVLLNCKYMTQCGISHKVTDVEIHFAKGVTLKSQKQNNCFPYCNHRVLQLKAWGYR